MTKNQFPRKRSLSSVFAIVAKVEKAKFLKLWLGVAEGIKEAEKMLEREVLLELMGQISRRDIKKLMVCEIPVKDIVSEIPVDLLPLYGGVELKEVVGPPPKKETAKKKKELFKNVLMKKIIKEKNKGLLKTYRKRFKECERKYLLDKIK